MRTANLAHADFPGLPFFGRGAGARSKTDARRIAAIHAPLWFDRLVPNPNAQP
jgi:hypothetical protein